MRQGIKKVLLICILVLFGGSQLVAAAERKETLANMRIEGERFPEIPTAGELLYTYQVVDVTGKSSEIPVSFYIEGEVEGLTISEDGILTVSKYAIPQEVTIIANWKGQQEVRYPIVVKNPWFIESEEVDGEQYGIPSAERVPSYSYAEEKKWIIIGNGILLLLSVGFAAFGIFYIRKIREKREKRK